MVTKRGQGIVFRLPGQAAASEAPATEAAAAGGARPRTGVGVLTDLIAGAHGQGAEVERLSEENARLKQQIGEQWIDPAEIALTRWADRHPDSFRSAEFLSLKDEIADAGGNVQPVKLRPMRDAAPSGPRYELVFGSRRTQACRELGLKVRAVIEEGLDDQGLYVQMQRENRGRHNLSAWEQGVSYRRALSGGLFPSARKLAESLGLDPSNVAKALRVADLPEEVVGAFASPTDIQFRWAVDLSNAMEAQGQAVRAAARALAREQGAGAPLKPAEVARRLVDAGRGVVPDQRTTVPAQGSVLRDPGICLTRFPDGRVLIEIDAGRLPEGGEGALMARLQGWIQSGG